LTQRIRSEGIEAEGVRLRGGRNQNGPDYGKELVLGSGVGPASGGRQLVKPIHRVSVVVPMRNEAAHVDTLMADISAQDFAGQIEVIVADGCSSDGSVELLRAAAARHGVALEVLPNPSRWVSQGLNACIRRARGDLIVRLDCHSGYPPDYIRRCALVAEETGAAAVGGIVVPKGSAPTERAVACAMDSPFGGIGWMRGTSQPIRRDSDSLTFGAFRPEAFTRVGLFDESLRRNQDDEFTLRLRRAGERVVLDSTIQVHYVPRDSLRGVFRQYFQYGFWKTAVIRKHRRIPSVRSAAPPLFVISLLVLIPAAVFLSPARWLLAAEVALYGILAVVFGASSLRRRREPWRLWPRVVSVFPVFHVAYGLGLLRASVSQSGTQRSTDGGSEAPAVTKSRAEFPSQ
jgi:succinoglycan biosynthesis protein ExoA